MATRSKKRRQPKPAAPLSPDEVEPLFRLALCAFVAAIRGDTLPDEVWRSSKKAARFADSLLEKGDAGGRAGRHEYYVAQVAEMYRSLNADGTVAMRAPKDRLEEIREPWRRESNQVKCLALILNLDPVADAPEILDHTMTPELLKKEGHVGTIEPAADTVHALLRLGARRTYFERKSRKEDLHAQWLAADCLHDLRKEDLEEVAAYLKLPGQIRI